MLLFDEMPQPLAWYDDIEKQSRYLSGFERHMYNLVVQHDRVLPFQIRFDIDESVKSFQLYNSSEVLVYDLGLEQLQSVKLIEQEFNYYLWLADNALKTKTGIDVSLACGQSYYLKITTDYGDYFSEVFEPLDKIDKYLMLEWFDEHNVDPAYYLGDFGFKFRLFVDTFITKGLPNVFVESEEDGYGEIIDISRKVNITYDIDFGVIPNFIYEAIAFMAIHSYVTITTPKYLREGDIKNISLEEAQIDGLAYWQLIMNFQQGRYYYNTTCGHDIRPQKVDEYIIDQGATQDSYDSFVEQQDLS